MSFPMRIARAIANEMSAHGCSAKPFTTVGGAVLVYLRDRFGNDQGRINVAPDGSISGKHLPDDRVHLLAPARAVAAKFS